MAERLSNVERLARKASRNASVSTAPAVRVYRGSDQTGLTTGAQNPIYMANTRYNNGWLRPNGGAIHDNAVNANLIYAPLAGVYALSAGCIWYSGTTGGVRHQLGIYVNATAVAYDEKTVQNTGEQTICGVSTQWKCAVDDYMHVQVYHTKGSNDAIYGGADAYPYLAVHYLGPG